MLGGLKKAVQTCFCHNFVNFSLMLITLGMHRGLDEPELSGAPFRYLPVSRSSRSGVFGQVSPSAFYLAFRRLFQLGENDGYEFITIHDDSLFY